MTVTIDHEGLAKWLNMEPRKKRWSEELFDAERKAGEEFERKHPPPEEP